MRSMHVVEERETHILASYAMHSADSAGREHPEPTHLYRGPYQRDRDRILHCSAFRRLSGKTQVFTGLSDYHRTRLTHTMEVASIARTIGRALRLNEDLIEALALVHDIGHPPFGHAGEDSLNDFLKAEGGFSHNRYGLTLVRELEQCFPLFAGLNLSIEVLEGQRRRIDKGEKAGAPLLEVQTVDLADSITYDAHDVDDAVQLGWLKLEDLLTLPLIARCHANVKRQCGTLAPDLLRRALVHELINLQVVDLVASATSTLSAYAGMSAQGVRDAGVTMTIDSELAAQKGELESYLFDRLYRHHDLLPARRVAQEKLSLLAERLVQAPESLPEPFRSRCQTHGVRQAVVDHLAGMTDRFCEQQFEKLMG